MIHIDKTRGIECRPVAALRAGITVQQLTASDAWESQHRYYDICPWSHDERFILFSSAPTNAAWTPFGHDTLACLEGRINLIDTQDMRIAEVAGPAAYLKHGAAGCIWHPTRHRIYYRESEHCYVGLDLDTGCRYELPGQIRQLSPDGSAFVTIMNGPHGGGQGAAIGLMSDEGADERLLVSRDQLYDVTPNRDEFRPEDMLLGNTKWRPDSQYILIAMWVYPAPHARRSLYIVSRDGSEIRWLAHFDNHHSWTPDGQQILFNDRTMFLVAFDGTNRRVAFDAPIGSHPLMHPDGLSILDADRDGIYVVRPAENRIERLVAFSQPFDCHTHHGTHPHPVWNRDGTKILYNSAESGHCEVYHVSM